MSARPILSRENLDHAVATTAHDPFTILTPDARAHALAAHDAVARDFLDARALLQAPEPQGRVMARADELPPFGAKRQAGNGVGMREHVVRALACWCALVHLKRYARD